MYLGSPVFHCSWSQLVPPKSAFVGLWRFFLLLLLEKHICPGAFPGGTHLLEPRSAAVSGSSKCKRHVLASLTRYSNTLYRQTFCANITDLLTGQDLLLVFAHVLYTVPLPQNGSLQNMTTSISR